MWRTIKSAPRDGTWIVIAGEMRGGDTVSTMVARYSPVTVETGTYEWEAVELVDLGLCDDEPPPLETNHYCEGRISGWMPLPAPPADGE